MIMMTINNCGNLHGSLPCLNERSTNSGLIIVYVLSLCTALSMN